MKKSIPILCALFALILTGCFEPKEKGIKGQAYISLGDKHIGHALVDFPIFCYGPSFEESLQAFKAELRPKLEYVQAENEELHAAWIEAENAYVEAVKVHFKGMLKGWIESNDEEIALLELSRNERFKDMKEQQQSDLDALMQEIQELEAQQRASSELAEVLSPFIAEQRRLLDAGYENINAEITRANDLIEKINKVIVEKGLALELYEKCNSDIEKEYTSIKTCWDGVPYLGYSSAYSLEVFSYSRFSRGVQFARSSYRDYFSDLPEELTPYLSHEIQKASYIHVLIADERLSDIREKLNNSEEEAGAALLVYANKNGISKDQVSSIIKSSTTPAAYDRQIAAKKSELNALRGLDILAAVTTEIAVMKSKIIRESEEAYQYFEATGNTDNLGTLYEVLSQMPDFNVSRSEFAEFLGAQGFKRPDLPDYLSVDFDDEILALYRNADLIVYTDLNGGFLIPEGVTRYFAVLEEGDDAYYWMAPITETKDEVRMTISSVTTEDLMRLIFPE